MTLSGDLGWSPRHRFHEASSPWFKKSIPRKIPNICYTMLYYITVILIHYIYLYINIFYIYMYIIRVFIYILQHLFIRVFAETLPQLRWPGSVAGEFPTVNISVQRWEAKSPTQINPGGPNHCTQMVQLVKRLSENPVFRSTSSGFLSPLNPC